MEETRLENNRKMYIEYNRVRTNHLKHQESIKTAIIREKMKLKIKELDTIYHQPNMLWLIQLVQSTQALKPCNTMMLKICKTIQIFNIKAKKQLVQ